MAHGCRSDKAQKDLAEPDAGPLEASARAVAQGGADLLLWERPVAIVNVDRHCVVVVGRCGV